MRTRSTSGDLSVHAVAGTYVVLLGMNIKGQSPLLNGLLGFAIHRTNHTENKGGWLSGIKTFRNAVPSPRPSQLVSTRDHPVQGFLWCDYSAKANHEYTYRIVCLYGVPGALTEGAAVEAHFRTESEGNGAHSIYFNRGAAASQAYARKFGNRPPNRQTNPDAYPWLSRGLEEGLLGFVGQAKGPGWGLRSAVYEFHYDRVLGAFRDAAARGVDVRIVYDAKPGSLKPRERNTTAIENAGIEALCTLRESNPSYIAHNKFIVLLEGQEPVAIWTGSTNISEGGIFGHSNVGHVIRDQAVARAFLNYWQQLAGDPKASQLRTWADKNPGVPDGPAPPGVTTIFSPRGSLAALDYYAALMRDARSGVFLTAAFGVNSRFRKVLATDRDYLRYLLLEREDKENPDDPDVELYKRDRDNVIAIGSHLTDDVLDQWVQQNFGAEELSGLNNHVRYIHTKYMLIDPLSDDPIVVTGSANFSNASTRNNDENMVIIRGDRRVADVYLGEFMRLFSHYRFREFAEQTRATGRTPEKLYLSDDDSWLRPFYGTDSLKAKERQLFS